MRQASAPRIAHPPWLAEASRTMERAHDSAAGISVAAMQGPLFAPREPRREATRVRSCRPASSALSLATDAGRSREPGRRGLHDDGRAARGGSERQHQKKRPRRSSVRVSYSPCEFRIPGLESSGPSYRIPIAHPRARGKRYKNATVLCGDASPLQERRRRNSQSAPATAPTSGAAARSPKLSWASPIAPPENSTIESWRTSPTTMTSSAIASPRTFGLCDMLRAGLFLRPLRLIGSFTSHAVALLARAAR